MRSADVGVRCERRVVLAARAGPLRPVCMECTRVWAQSPRYIFVYSSLNDFQQKADISAYIHAKKDLYPDISQSKG